MFRGYWLFETMCQIIPQKKKIISSEVGTGKPYEGRWFNAAPERIFFLNQTHTYTLFGRVSL